MDWYLVLELEPGADVEAVKAAHRRLARKWHPDTNPDPAAHERMLEINRARDVLLDPALRAAFDREVAKRLAVERARRAAHAEAEAEAELERRTRRVRGSVRQGTSGPAWDPRWAEEARTARKPEPQPGSYRRPDARPDHARNWYRFLRVAPTATTEEIRAAMGRIALELDRAPITASELMQRKDELRQAWATLGDAGERRRYDDRLRKGR